MTTLPIYFSINSLISGLFNLDNSIFVLIGVRQIFLTLNLLEDDIRNCYFYYTFVLDAFCLIYVLML